MESNHMLVPKSSPGREINNGETIKLLASGKKSNKQTQEMLKAKIRLRMALTFSPSNDIFNVLLRKQ